MQERVNLLKCTKPLPRGQLLIQKKSKNAKMQIDKKMQKHEKNKTCKKSNEIKSCTFAPAIITLYLLFLHTCNQQIS